MQPFNPWPDLLSEGGEWGGVVGGFRGGGRSGTRLLTVWWQPEERLGNLYLCDGE